MIPQLPESMGLKLTKHTPELYQKHLENYQPAVDWIRKQLLDHGYDCNEAVLDPYTERWTFYERREPVLILHNDVVERVLGILLWKDYMSDKG